MTPAALMLAAALFAGSVSAFADAARADAAKLVRYGEHLSQECTACHRRDGVDNGIPSILGMKAEDFEETLKFYKTGARENPAMVSVAQSLDDDQVKALAAYFASLPLPGKAAPATVQTK
ncbi:MAG: c-type cytochrome [Hyphomicrobium sp.]